MYGLQNPRRGALLCNTSRAIECANTYLYLLESKETLDLKEEFLRLLNMRKVCRAIESNPFDLWHAIEEGLHCAFLDVLFRPSNQEGWCFDGTKKRSYGGPILQ